MARPLARFQPARAFPPQQPALSSFYREEFLKHLELLRLQHGCFSEGALASAEQALDRILAQIDALCARQNATEVCGRLLASFDCVTGASWLNDRKNLH
jgi:hypothetical protein